MTCISVEGRRAVVDVALMVPKLDVTGYDEGELSQALADARLAQRCLDGYVLRLGSQANRLCNKGESAPADETLLGEGTGRVKSGQARDEAKRSEAADEMPGLGDAVSTGAASKDHIDSVARHLKRLTPAQRDLVDLDDLVARAKWMTPEPYDKYVKRLVDRMLADHGLADTKAKRKASEFRHWFDQKTGMGRFSGSLDPERYEALTNAIDQHMAALAAASSGTGDEPVKKDRNLAAAALVELVLAAGGRDARNRLPSVTVLVDHDTVVHGAHDESVRQTEQGHDVPPETIARLCCDATVRRVTMDATGVPINVGRKYRTATDAQWAAIKSLHDTCAWSDCSAPISCRDVLAVGRNSVREEHSDERRTSHTGMGTWWGD